MSKKRISYNLLSSLTEEEYNAMPEEARKVYVSVAKNIPMFDSEKLRIIQKYPECFEKVQSKSYGDKVKRLMSLKEKVRSVKSEVRRRKSKARSRTEQLATIKEKGFGTRIKDLQFIPTDEAEFTGGINADQKFEGEITKLKSGRVQFTAQHPPLKE